MKNLRNIIVFEFENISFYYSCVINFGIFFSGLKVESYWTSKIIIKFIILDDTYNNILRYE